MRTASAAVAAIAATIAVAVAAGRLAAVDGAPAPLAVVGGKEFSGGGAPVYGYSPSGYSGVNYVYARSTGLDRIRAEVTLAIEPPAGAALLLAMEGRNNDHALPCPIAITLNGADLHRGDQDFPSDRFSWRSFTVPPGALRAGKNVLEVSCLVPAGPAGNPPWFMLREVRLGPAGMELPRAPWKVEVPAGDAPIPDVSRRERPGFEVRGMKGWAWLPEQYLAEIPFLAAHRFNFLMSCYGSMCDVEVDPRVSEVAARKLNHWYRPLPEEKKRKYEEVVHSAKEHGIDFCFAMNPNLWSDRPLRYGSEEDYQALVAHYDWMQGLGVRWFSLSYDDIGEGIDAAGQTALANRLFGHLREKDPGARLIFCPTTYHNADINETSRKYLEYVGEHMDPAVDIFWTGPQVYAPRITAEDVAVFAKLIRRKPFVWDNYPVNDQNPVLRLGPLQHRAPDLHRHVAGWISNPLYENDINRLPLLTVADYLWDPEGYDPCRSIGRAIRILGETAAQREVLRDLVGWFPGFFDPPPAGPETKSPAEKARLLEELRARLVAAFPGRYADVLPLIDQEIAAAKRAAGAAGAEKR